MKTDSETTKTAARLIPDALGTPWTPLGLSWAPLGRPWPRLGRPWPCLGLPVASLGLLYPPRGQTLSTAGATLGSSGADLWHPLDTPWTPLLPSWEHVPKKVKKITPLNHFLELFQRRVHMQSAHACAVQTHIEALFLTLVSRPQKMQKVFSHCGSEAGHPRHIGGEGGTRAPKASETCEREK